MELTPAEKQVMVETLEKRLEVLGFPKSHDLKNALKKIKKIEPKPVKT